MIILKYYACFFEILISYNFLEQVGLNLLGITKKLSYFLQIC